MLYSQNDVSQSGGEGVARPCALPRASTRAPAPLDWSFFKPVLRSFKGLIQDISNCKKKKD